ncbi:MAG: hypothetical protein KC549_00810 [Myxococcales bacterium]|nr:hypothetical protein [Myxococcales bacterium]MCB9545819.1 hypothetical protein [Myxococcales bacterium]
MRDLDTHSDALVRPDVADYLIELAAALDGDDHLYSADERLGRQALWTWINERDRTISAGGTHSGSDWSWKLHFAATGCALGVAEAPRPPAGEACGPATCEGCCSAGRCMAGGDEQTCGRGGGACQSCGSGETCGGGACRFDDNATFSLKVLYADVAFTKANGDCWDDIFGGCDDPPDPYLEASSGGRSGRTGLERDTWRPSWNTTVLPGVRARDLMSRVTFEVTDDDLQFDDLIGRCSFAMSAYELQAGGSLSVECGQSVVTFEVKPQ